MNTLGRGLTCLLGVVYIGQIRPFEGLELIERIGAFIFHIHHPQRGTEVCAEFKIENKETVDAKVDEFDDLLDINSEAAIEHQIDACMMGRMQLCKQIMFCAPVIYCNYCNVKF